MANAAGELLIVFKLLLLFFLIYTYVKQICVLKGGIDNDEDPKNAAIRELREETGVSSALVVSEVSLSSPLVLTACLGKLAVVELVTSEFWSLYN